MAVDQKIIGIILVLMFSVGGVSVYEFAEEGVSGRLTHSQYKQLATELPDNIPVAIIDQSSDRVEIITKSDECDYTLFRIDEDEVTIKCGWNIVSQIDFKTRYYNKHEGEWYENDRKATLVNIIVEPISEGVGIVLETPYYRKSGFSRYGDAGILRTTFEVSKEKVKISQNLSNTFKTFKVCAGVRVKRIEANAFFVELDDAFLGEEDNVFWYCSENGEGLLSDPAVGIDRPDGSLKISDRAVWERANGDSINVNYEVSNGGEVSVLFEKGKDTEFKYERNYVYAWFESGNGFVHSFKALRNVTLANYITQCSVVSNGSNFSEVCVDKLTGNEVVEQWIDLPVLNNVNEGKTVFYAEIKNDCEIRMVPVANINSRVKYYVGITPDLDFSNFGRVEVDPYIIASTDEISRWDTGNPLTDLESYNELEAVGSPTYTTSTIGDFNVNVIDLDGSNDWFRNTSGVRDLDLHETGGTWSMWVNPDVNTDGVLMTTGYFSDAEERTAFRFVAGGKIRSTHHVNPAENNGVSSVDAIPNNQWTFITMVVNKTTWNIEIWINETLDASDQVGVFEPSNDTTFSIGAFHGGEIKFNGQIYCPRVFNASLNKSHIEAVFNGGQPTCVGLNNLMNPLSFSNVQNNASTVSRVHYNVSFGANVSGNDLSFIRVAHNDSGEFVNGSLKKLQGEGDFGFINSTFNITQPYGSHVCFKVWANDSAQIKSEDSCFDVANTPPVVNDLQINNTPIKWDEDANVSWIFSDVDNGTQSEAGFSIRWFIEGLTVTSANDQRLFLKTNYSVGDNIWASVNVTDGVDNSSTLNVSNTSIVTIEGGGGHITDLNISLDFRSANRTYGIGTTPLIRVNSTNDSFQICLRTEDAFYGTNVTCVSGSDHLEYNMTLWAVSNETFDDRTTSKTLSTSPGQVSFLLTNKSDFLNVSLTINGGENVTVYDGNETRIIIPGRLTNDVSVWNTSYFGGELYEVVNLSYSQAGSKTFYVNVSTANYLTSFGRFNFSFNMTGFLIDNGNDFESHEMFSSFNSNIINTSVGALNETRAPNSTYAIFDSIEYNDSEAYGSWSFDCSASNVWCKLFTYKFAEDISLDIINDGCAHILSSGVDVSYVTYNALDLRDVSRINVSVVEVVQCGGGGSKAYTKTIITDGSTDVILNERANTCGPGDAQQGSFVGSYVIYKNVGTSSYDWSYFGHVNPGTIPNSGSGSDSYGSLDPDIPWYFKWRASSNDGASATVRVRQVEMGGVGLNMTPNNFNGTNYTSNGTVQSVNLSAFDTPVRAATLTALVKSNSNWGSSIIYYLSNDNGTTWEKVFNGERHVFDSVGNGLNWKVHLYSDSKLRYSPVIYDIKAEVVASQAANISVDFGDDGVDDCGVDTNLTAYICFNSSDPLRDYVGDYCSDVLSCWVPVKVTSEESGGVVEISNVSIIQQFGKIFINSSKYDGSDNITLNVSFVGGPVVVNGSRVDYRGYDIFNISAFAYNSSCPECPSYLQSSVNLTITTHWADFTKAFPANISYWSYATKIYSRDQKNITPLGQDDDNPIRNITSECYSSVVNFSFWIDESFADLGVSGSVNLTLSADSSKVNKDYSSFVYRQLFGWWSFDSYNSTHAFDNSSFGNNGTFEGGLSTADITTDAVRGTALEFDGVGDYVQVPNAAEFNFSGSFSISVWVKPDADCTVSQIVDMRSVSGYEMYLGGSSSTVVCIDYGPSTDCIASTTAIDDENWHHIVYVRDNTAGTHQLYIDNVKEGDEADTTTGKPINSSNDFFIGSNQIGTANFFNGTIDEVMIFNRSLSQQEVSTFDKVNPIINTTPQYLFQLSNLGDSSGVWNWLDIDVTSGGLYLPVMWINAICEDCVHTADWAENKYVVN